MIKVPPDAKKVQEKQNFNYMDFEKFIYMKNS